MPAFRSLTLHARWALLLLVLTLVLPGCAAMQSQSREAPTSFMPDWSEALKLPPPNSELTGFSEKSREIERRLGVQ